MLISTCVTGTVVLPASAFLWGTSIGIYVCVNYRGGNLYLVQVKIAVKLVNILLNEVKFFLSHSAHRAVLVSQYCVPQPGTGEASRLWTWKFGAPEYHCGECYIQTVSVFSQSLHAQKDMLLFIIS